MPADKPAVQWKQIQKLIDIHHETTHGGIEVKISSAISTSKVNVARSEPTAGPTNPFKDVLELFAISEKVVNASTSAVPTQLKGLMDLQRSSHVLQIQVECVSRIADSVTSSIKKVQQLGGQG